MCNTVITNCMQTSSRFRVQIHLYLPGNCYNNNKQSHVSFDVFRFWQTLVIKLQIKFRLKSQFCDLINQETCLFQSTLPAASGYPSQTPSDASSSEINTWWSWVVGTPFPILAIPSQSSSSRCAQTAPPKPWSYSSQNLVESSMVNL